MKKQNQTRTHQNQAGTCKNPAGVLEFVNNHLKGFSANWASVTNVRLHLKMINTVASKIIIQHAKELGK